MEKSLQRKQDRIKARNTEPEGCLHDHAEELKRSNTALNAEIAEHKLLEKKLKAAEKKNRTWLEHSPVCTKILDLDFNLQYMSAAGIAGLKIDDITQFYGKPFPLDFYPESFSNCMIRDLEKVKQGGEIITQEGALVDTKGNELWFESTLVPVNDDEGQLDYIMVVSVDINERKRAEQERERLIAKLETQNTELEQFTYTVSHDLKSPLITINGFVGMLRKDLAEGNSKHLENNLSLVDNATRKMDHLLSDLLELSRIGRLVNPSEDVPLEELTRETLELVHGQAKKNGVQVEISPDLPVVFGDRLRLREVLQNLIDNAVKYMGDQSSPRVEIGSRDDGDETIVYVHDNGIGINPRYHQRIFGLFDQLEPNDPRVEGSGIGLSLAKRIVEVHGGRIWVESEGLGHGSTFCFTLATKSHSTAQSG